MFKSFFKKDDDEDIFETVDPIVEQRRNEKFSKPLIYDEEFEEKKKNETKQKEVKIKKEEPQSLKQETKIANVKIEKKGYEMMDIISPMFGLAEEKDKKNVNRSTKKKTQKKSKKEIIL